MLGMISEKKKKHFSAVFPENKKKVWKTILVLAITEYQVAIRQTCEKRWQPNKYEYIFESLNWKKKWKFTISLSTTAGPGQCWRRLTRSWGLVTSWQIYILLYLVFLSWAINQAVSWWLRINKVPQLQVGWGTWLAHHCSSGCFIFVRVVDNGFFYGGVTQLLTPLPLDTCMQCGQYTERSQKKALPLICIF